MLHNDVAQQRPSEKLASAPKASQQTLQQPHGQAGILGQTSELTPWLARHHPFWEGHKQARSVLRPEQGTEHGMLPLHATQELQQKPVPSQHTALQTPGNTQATATAQYTHSTLLKCSNQPMAAARRRQGQQLYAWHGTPCRRPQAAPLFPLTLAGEDEDIEAQPLALPPEAWPCECNTRPNSQREIRSS